MHIVGFGAECVQHTRQVSGRGLELVDEVLEIGARAARVVDVLQMLRDRALIGSLGDGDQAGLIEDDHARGVVAHGEGLEPRNVSALEGPGVATNGLDQAIRRGARQHTRLEIDDQFSLELRPTLHSERGVDPVDRELEF